jgi:hypothetical protein
MVLSIGSAAATAYFWLVRNNAERPRLRSHWGVVEGVECNAGKSDATWRVGLRLKVVVTNASALPNALLDVRASVKGQEGAWLPAQRESIAGRSVGPVTELPLNLPAQQAVVVRTWAWFEAPRTSGVAAPHPDRPHTWEPYLSSLGQPLQVRVELRALRGRTFTNVVTRSAGSVAKAPPPLC